MEILVSEYAKKIGKSNSTVYNMIRNGSLSCVIKSNRKYITIDEPLEESVTKESYPKEDNMEKLEKKLKNC